MRRFLAGVYDPRRRDAGNRERVERVLAAEGPSQSVSAGALTVGWTGDDASPAGGGRICLIDGAVYELDALRDRLGLPGASAEALVAAGWTRDADAFLPTLRGDFGLLVWDPERGAGVLACDQMGARSMAWHEANGVITFASEIHLLLALLDTTPGPDPVAVAHWLAISGLPDGHTLYHGVNRLGASQLLNLHGPPAARRYWTPRYARSERISADEAVERLRDALVVSVRRRSIDRPSLAVMLSGGLDSGAVAAIAQTAAAPEGSLSRSYSATFPNHPSADEAELITSVGAALDLPNVRIEVEGGSILAGALPYLARWRVPPVSPNLFFWIPLLQRAAQDGTRILLDGEGGDEVFSYSPYLLADRLRRGRILSLVSLMRRIPGSEGRLERRWAPSWFKAYALKGAVPHRLHQAVRRRRGPAGYAPAWFFEQTARDYAETDPAAHWKAFEGPRWWAFLVSATSRGMGPALMFDHIRRRGAMAGIESRHPLLDVDVLELMLGLPPELAWDPARTRPLLRRAVEGALPDEVRLRARKSSFDPPFHDGLVGPDLPAVRRLLGAPDAAVGAFVDQSAIRRELLDVDPPPPPGRQAWALWVWRLTTAELWLRSLSDPGLPERLAAELGLEAARYRLVEVGASC